MKWKLLFGNQKRSLVFLIYRVWIAKLEMEFIYLFVSVHIFETWFYSACSDQFLFMAPETQKCPCFWSILQGPRNSWDHLVILLASPDLKQSFYLDYICGECNRICWQTWVLCLEVTQPGHHNLTLVWTNSDNTWTTRPLGTLCNSFTSPQLDFILWKNR